VSAPRRPSQQARSAAATAAPKPKRATRREASTAPARQTTVDLAQIDQSQPTTTKSAPHAHQTTVDLADLGGP
jgi:hypothetical protein